MTPRLLSLSVFLFALACSGALAAQTELHWKLEPGQKLQLETSQQTTSQVTFSGKSAKTNIDVAITLNWEVTGADESGSAIKQKVQRIVLKLAAPQGPPVEYDSAAAGRPSGQARQIADAMKPLLAAELSLLMSNRGEIVKLEAANDAAREWLSGAGDQAAQPALSSKTIQQIFRQPLVILPEKPVAVGDSWTRAADISASAGEFRQSTTYKVAGQEEQDGQSVLKIESTSQLEPATAAEGSAANVGQNKLKIKTHEQSGTILFSIEGGRVVEATETQKLVTERPYRDTIIVVTLTSTQKTTLKGAE